MPTERNLELRVANIVFSDHDARPHADGWIGMANNVDGASKWLHIGGISERGVRRLTLQADRVNVSGNLGIGTEKPQARLDVAGDVAISGALRVAGDQNLLKVQTEELVVRNGGIDKAGEWKVELKGFAQVYAAYAVLGGFTLKAPTTVPAKFGTPPDLHEPNVGAIPQHVYVRVTSVDNSAVKGDCYCSESEKRHEADNGVLFTVVALGKPA